MLGFASGRIRSSQKTYKSPQEAPRPLTGSGVLSHEASGRNVAGDHVRPAQL
jgi:hypothetical protein